MQFGCITEIFEKIDLENYDNITEERISNMITESGLNDYFNEEKNKSHVDFTITNYKEEAEVEEDLIKKINITVTYKIGGKNITFPISKVKVRE